MQQVLVLSIRGNSVGLASQKPHTPPKRLQRKHDARLGVKRGTTRAQPKFWPQLISPR